VTMIRADLQPFAPLSHRSAKKYQWRKSRPLGQSKSIGKGFNAGRSISSSNCRRVTPSRRIGRSWLRSFRSSPIAAGRQLRPSL
jgi:hypothetical protein